MAEKAPAFITKAGAHQYKVDGCKTWKRNWWTPTDVDEQDGIKHAVELWLKFSAWHKRSAKITFVNNQAGGYWMRDLKHDRKTPTKASTNVQRSWGANPFVLQSENQVSPDVDNLVHEDCNAGR